MRREAARPDGRIDEAILLWETGFPVEARRLARALVAESPRDPARLGLKAQLDHRAGALSEALEGWRKLHDISPNSHAAILRLAAMQGEGALPGTGLPLVRRALRQVAQGPPARGQRAVHEALAVARSAGDREQYKLLSLLEALLLEIAGQPARAAAVLESMGHDPEFAHDLDRLAVLARVSERTGDRVRLASAERVLSYLASSGKLSAFPRLSAVRRALGDEAGARRADDGYLEAFQERMHELDPVRRLAAAERCYVPPERLDPASLPPPESVEGAARGVVLLVRGDAGAALPLLSGAWRAAALARLGRREEALAEASAAIASAAHVLPLALLVAGLLGPGDRVPRQALEALRSAVAAGRVESSILLALASLEEREGRADRAAALRTRAAAAPSRPAPGIVRAAAVYLLPGKPKGLVHDIIARRRPAGAGDRGRLVERDLLGHFGPGMRAAVRRHFAAVRDLLEARLPEQASDFDRFTYGLHVTKEDEPSSGVSFGLPVALAFASVLLQRPVARTIAVTGALSYDGAGTIAVRPVGEVGVKLKGALRAGASTLILPEAQREEALSGHAVPRLLAERAIAPVATFDEALTLALGEV